MPSEIAEMLKNVNLIKELSEGYKVRKSEEKKLAQEWDTTSGDGIDSSGFQVNMR